MYHSLQKMERGGRTTWSRTHGLQPGPESNPLYHDNHTSWCCPLGVHLVGDAAPSTERGWIVARYRSIGRMGSWSWYLDVSWATRYVPESPTVYLALLEAHPWSCVCSFPTHHHRSITHTHSRWGDNSWWYEVPPSIRWSKWHLVCCIVWPCTNSSSVWIRISSPSTRWSSPNRWLKRTYPYPTHGPTWSGSSWMPWYGQRGCLWLVMGQLRAVSDSQHWDHQTTPTQPPCPSCCRSWSPMWSTTTFAYP